MGKYLQSLNIAAKVKGGGSEKFWKWKDTQNGGVIFKMSFFNSSMTYGEEPLSNAVAVALKIMSFFR